MEFMILMRSPGARFSQYGNQMLYGIISISAIFKEHLILVSGIHTLDEFGSSVKKTKS